MPRGTDGLCCLVFLASLVGLGCLYGRVAESPRPSKSAELQARLRSHARRDRQAGSKNDTSPERKSLVPAGSIMASTIRAASAVSRVRVAYPESPGPRPWPLLFPSLSGKSRPYLFWCMNSARNCEGTRGRFSTCMSQKLEAMTAADVSLNLVQLSMAVCFFFSRPCFAMPVASTQKDPVCVSSCPGVPNVRGLVQKFRRIQKANCGPQALETRPLAGAFMRQSRNVSNDLGRCFRVRGPRGFMQA